MFDVNYQGLVIMEDHVAQKLKQYKTDIKKAGFKEWIYIKVKHLIKRKIRHCWFDQDLLNMKKYIEYYRYYKNYK